MALRGDERRGDMRLLEMRVADGVQGWQRRKLLARAREIPIINVVDDHMRHYIVENSRLSGLRRRRERAVAPVRNLVSGVRPPIEGDIHRSSGAPFDPRRGEDGKTPDQL